MTKILNNPS